MKIISIVGARPQFIKIAPLARSFDGYNRKGGSLIEHRILHTGQHYDPEMSDCFFDELEIPRPMINLGVGSASHGKQTGQMLEKIEQVLLEQRTDMVVVVGDTNSTLAGALAAAKLRIPVAHIESGLRCFNRQMPEELNRVATDHLSDLLLVPTPTAMKNLQKEGLSSKAVLTGDIMYDAVLFGRHLAERRSNILERLSLRFRQYGLITVHRSESTDDDARLGGLLEAFNDIAANMLQLIFPVHPRTAKMVAANFPNWRPHPRLHIIEPVGYLDLLCLASHARVMLTDSGGLQKEALFLHCPCITLRDETEWIETVQAGANILAGVEPDRICDALAAWDKRLSAGRTDFSAKAIASFGDGDAADKIRDAILAFDHAD